MGHATINSVNGKIIFDYVTFDFETSKFRSHRITACMVLGYNTLAKKHAYYPFTRSLNSAKVYYVGSIRFLNFFFHMYQTPHSLNDVFFLPHSINYHITFYLLYAKYVPIFLGKKNPFHESDSKF